MRLRASIGTAVLLELDKALLLEKPTTAYFMLSSDSKCFSNCMFCPQASESSSRSDQLSRVLWPEYPLESIIRSLLIHTNTFHRCCIQTLKYKKSTQDLIAVLEQFQKNNLAIPVSVCSYPLAKIQLQKLKSLGVERMGISFDCASEEIFNKIKGRGRGTKLTWEKMNKALNNSIEVFGEKFTSTHLIIGLGETEREAVNFIQKYHNKGITIGLFAFTPIKGTELERTPQPSIEHSEEFNWHIS